MMSSHTPPDGTSANTRPDLLGRVNEIINAVRDLFNVITGQVATAARERGSGEILPKRA